MKGCLGPPGRGQPAMVATMGNAGLELRLQALAGPRPGRHGANGGTNLPTLDLWRVRPAPCAPRPAPRAPALSWNPCCCCSPSAARGRRGDVSTT